jgi:hypothetical protein
LGIATSTNFFGALKKKIRHAESCPDEDGVALDGVSNVASFRNPNLIWNGHLTSPTRLGLRKDCKPTLKPTHLVKTARILTPPSEKLSAVDYLTG